MSEIFPVVDEAAAMARRGERGVLCVVVRKQGSAPQEPGAALLVRPDLTTLGTLGGGCVEAEVVRRAFALLSGPGPVSSDANNHAKAAPQNADVCGADAGAGALMAFMLDHDYGWDDGLICGGRMEIAAVPVGAIAGPLERAAALARERRPAWVPLAVRDEQGGAVQHWRVWLEPAARLIIAGGGHVGQALAALAAQLDFEVTVIDDREQFASAGRFPEGTTLIVQDIAAALMRQPLDAATSVVIVTRGHAHDAQALRAVIESPAGYVGMIGSARKKRTIYDDLLAAGIAQELLDRVHCPVGLPIHAVTVNEIAVSIAAQLIEHRRRDHRRLVEGPLSTPWPAGEWGG